MNKTILLLFPIFIFVFSNQLSAKTLTDGITFENSGLYFEPNVKIGATYSTAGIQALWVFKHAFSIGITYNQSGEIESETSNYYYDAKLYGISANYTFEPDSWVHLNVACSLGGGTLKLMEKNELTDDLGTGSINYFELGLSGELNIAKYMRAAIGALYLYAQHSLENSTEPQLSQPMFYIGLKFGVF